ncbi:tyrosine-type recombinase/integrase [Mesorhizobium amorphae]|uniref:tyrosine-type recombinase/integrase n=1 Tax=Mesorhizobium amorphae TaxID=71433 RepID=UPI0011846AA7|nr:site-specific integrase [Mesorhizobium amorphae]
MVTVDLQGIHRVRAKGRTYYYAWRGGPRLKGTPGSPEFMASLSEAAALRRVPENKKFAALVTQYRNSGEFERLAVSTKRTWLPWLDNIKSHFGELSIGQFDRTLQIRRAIRQWRGQYAQKPRTADFGIQVLSRVLSYAVDPLGLLESNPCTGIKHLYKGGSRAEIVWSDDDLAHLKISCSQEIADAVDLAGHTGLRRGDAIRLSWPQVGESAIITTTGKSNHQREAVIPLYKALRDVLARIPRRSPFVLTSSKGTPWTDNGFSSSFQHAMADAWPQGKDLHFHDLRGTAATKFYLAGFSEREIAEILAWDEDSVSKIIRRYVGRLAAIKDRIRKLDDAGK